MAEPMDLSNEALERTADGLWHWGQTQNDAQRRHIVATFRGIRDAATAAEREKHRVTLEFLERASVDNGEHRCILCEQLPHDADCTLGNALAALRGGAHE